MLFGHMQPGKCRVTFVGDSTVHDVWAAAVADAMHELRLPLASCDFNGVHGDWLREEGAFCQANKSVDELRRLPKESLLTCNATFAETAVVTGGTCTSVVLDYWQSAMLVVPRYFRRVEPPAPLLLMQTSSFVFLGGGVHANSERDLERIANTTISPFLLTALRQADRQAHHQADRQVADRQVIRRSASAMTSASWKRSTVGRAPDTAPVTARAAGGVASPGGKVGGKVRQLARSPDMAGLARLLWLETLPQHFPGEDGSGTFRWSAMAASPRCEPIQNQTAANWRNRYLDGWAGRLLAGFHGTSLGTSPSPADLEHPSAILGSLGTSPAPVLEHPSAMLGSPSGSAILGRTSAPRSEKRPARRPSVQPAPPWVRLRLFHLFLDRHDMHGSSTDPKTRRIPGVGVDCTHFCFSPWLYAPVWDAAVNAALGLAAVPLP
jgi:hypothetical protein